MQDREQRERLGQKYRAYVLSAARCAPWINLLSLLSVARAEICARNRNLYFSIVLTSFDQPMKKIRVNHNYRRPFASNDEETLMESIILSRCCLCQHFVVSKRESKRRFVKHELFFGVNYLWCVPVVMFIRVTYFFMSLSFCSFCWCLTAPCIFIEQRKCCKRWRSQKRYNNATSYHYGNPPNNRGPRRGKTRISRGGTARFHDYIFHPAGCRYAAFCV